MVSPDTTRMLVLGVTQIFEPANGYQLRRELLSWDVEAWANINPGSIYSMLSTLTKQGMLSRADLVATPGARPVAVYSTTKEGRQELLRLVGNGLTEVDSFDQAGFYTALSIMATVLTRGEIIGLLEMRQKNLARALSGILATIHALDETKSAPPHVARLLEFAVTLRTAEQQWLAGFLEALHAGEMAFAGEEGMEQWKPLPNDPAWRMVSEREAYLKELGRN
ncbi:MAG: PadR family transcriptional regulator [Lacisediminihabitans sp.]